MPGFSNQELDRVPGISDPTLKAHLRAICAQLNAADRAEAVARAYALGGLSVEGDRR